MKIMSAALACPGNDTEQHKYECCPCFIDYTPGKIRSDVVISLDLSRLPEDASGGQGVMGVVALLERSCPVHLPGWESPLVIADRRALYKAVAMLTAVVGVAGAVLGSLALDIWTGL